MSFPTAKPPTSRTLMRCLGDLCRPALERGVQLCDADRYVKRYDSAGFGLSLIAFYLLGLSSQRELHARLTGDSRLQHLVGWGGISVSQLLKLPHARPTELWQPLIAELLQRVPAKQRSGKLRILDTSFFTMGIKLMQRHHPNKRMTHPATAGFKLGVVLDPDSGIPVHIINSVGQGTDTAHLDALVPPDQPIDGHTFLFDRGFRKYEAFDRLIANGAHFITRATAMIRYEVIETVALDPAHAGILSDQIVRLGKPNARNRMTHLTRRIELRADGKKIQIITSDLQRDAWAICEDYRIRWDIELFFRWIKSNLGCHRALGYTQTALEHTFWAAIAAYLIILLLGERQQSPNTGRMTFRIAPTLHRVRAVINEPPCEGDLQALGFL